MPRLVQKLEQRIGDQVDEINRRLHALSITDIREYYWDTKSAESFGIGATPAPSRSILPQLLLTPKLIIDIVPLPRDKFVQTYGVTPFQMHALAEEGYVIPNIYFYKDEGWRDYSKYRQIAQMLSEYGRPNTEWISRYLEAQHGFSSFESQYTEFFQSVSVGRAERQRLLKASHERIPDWDRFSSVYGQRLAYIHVLGGPAGSNVLGWVQDAYQTPGMRTHAIRTLNVSKYLWASEITAAYGTKYTIVPEHLADIAKSMSQLELLVQNSKALRKSVPKSRPAAANQFARELATRATVAKKRSSSPLPDVRELSRAQFKHWKDALDLVKDGTLGRAIDSMTETLLVPDSNLEPTVREYRELEREIDSALRPLAPTAAQLKRIGSLLTAPFEAGIRGDWACSAAMIGGSCYCWASRMEDKELIPFFFQRSRPKRLYGNWRAVKRSMQLT